MDLVGMTVAENRRRVEMTVLFRKNGTWHDIEVSRLVNGLMTEASQHPEHPEYLILYGHYSKEQTLEALLGGIAYTATMVIGINDPSLPFIPGFV